jgi:FkbM family methyltransferase
MNFDEYLKLPLPIDKELDLLFKNVKPKIIFEIGAAQSEDTIKYAQKFPKASIYAFEPLPVNYEKGKVNIQKHAIKNVNLYNIGMSDKEGKSQFFVSSLNSNPSPNSIADGLRSSSLFSPGKHLAIYTNVLFDNSTYINCITLDIFCKQHEINHIDFIQMDVQGAELLVLRGGMNALKKTDVIWLEVSNIDLYSNQPKANDIHNFMKSNGFKLLIDALGEVYGDRLYVSHAFYEKHRITCYYIQIIKRLKNVFS